MATAEMVVPSVESVRNWTQKHRPDLISHIEQAIDNQALWALMSIGFEAGRVFQSNNPQAELDFPPSPFDNYKL
jgi:hypothetical protein